MFRKTIQRLSGHGDLFPTSKEAAHLAPEWVLSRTPPPPPGPGKRYVSTTQPERFNQYQLHTAEVHNDRVLMQIGHAPPAHCTTPVPSNTSVAHSLGGVNAYLRGYHHAKDFSSPIARANIAEKEQSEKFAKTRTFTEHQRPARDRPGWERTIDMTAMNEYFGDRTCMLKTVDVNPKGPTKEWFPFEKKPAPATPPPPKK
ncbi:hypothetical protein AGDE_11119 [Angomonas deanei]|nr:hypothetical protein AGDE_11119 [Angomonas deanei]|eukprot:EPY26734.1 hypothetical protein AGDE_11119 [Angomonas deanei]